MKITTDPEQGEFDGFVKAPPEMGGYAKVTSSAKVVLHTDNVVTGVCLCLIERLNKIRNKRALAHLDYSMGNGQEFDEKKGGLIVPKKEVRQKVVKDLGDLLRNFEEPRAILIHNGFKKDNEGKLINPLANYMYGRLLNRGVALIFPDNAENANLSGKYAKEPTVAERLREWGDGDSSVYYKRVGLHDRKLIVQYLAFPKKGANFGVSLDVKEFPFKLNA
jgi:hypothetical protein